MALKILGLLLHTNFLIFYTKHFIKSFLIWSIFSMGLTILRMILDPDPMEPTKTGKAILNRDKEIHKMI